MAPPKRDYMSNLNKLMYASRRGSAQKSLFRAYTLVCEHFEPIRNPPHILADHGTLDAFLRWVLEFSGL
jgi:hypothetical protein